MSGGRAMELIKYDAACRALAKAKQVDEVKRRPVEARTLAD